MYVFDEMDCILSGLAFQQALRKVAYCHQSCLQCDQLIKFRQLRLGSVLMVVSAVKKQDWIGRTGQATF